MTSYVTGSQFELPWGRHKRFQEKISSRTPMKFRTQLEFEVSTARYNEAVRSVWTRVTGVVFVNGFNLESPKKSVPKKYLRFSIFPVIIVSGPCLAIFWIMAYLF